MGREELLHAERKVFGRPERHQARHHDRNFGAHTLHILSCFLRTGNCFLVISVIRPQCYFAKFLFFPGFHTFIDFKIFLFYIFAHKNVREIFYSKTA